MSIITINGVSVDPLAPRHSLSASLFHAPDAASSDYILIQTAQPLTAEQKAELSAKDVQILEYVPEDTHMCQYKGTDLSAPRQQRGAGAVAKCACGPMHHRCEGFPHLAGKTNVCLGYSDGRLNFLRAIANRKQQTNSLQ